MVIIGIVCGVAVAWAAMSYLDYRIAKINREARREVRRLYEHD